MVKLGYILIVFFVVGVSFKTECSEEKDFLDTYARCTNIILKKHLIQSICIPESTQVPKNSPLESWKIEFLRTIIKTENNPLIVEEAIRQIPYDLFMSFNYELINVFREADARFSQHASKVRLVVLARLCKEKTPGLTRMLQEFLSFDTGSDLAEDVLLAIEKLRDVTLINAVAEYAQKMELITMHLKMRNTDIAFYSRYQNYADLARDVEKALLSAY